MKQNKSHIVIIILFIAMITLPQIVFWITKDETVEVSTTENRKLNKKPELELATITEYPKKFDNYYNDHLPFRTELRNMWTSLNYDLFNMTVDNRVIAGKEGWLFYRGDKTIEQLQGVAKYTQKDKQNILTNLQSDVDTLKEKGIDTYVLILPNKENIYREYLPDTIPVSDGDSRTEELIKYIKENSNINIVYPKEELLNAKEKYQVYRKYDTHWNKIGAFIGTIELQKRIEPSFNYNFNEMQIKEKDAKDGRDLANFASLNNKLYENAVIVSNFYSDIEYAVEKKNKLEVYTSNSKNNKTVLFIGDSFRENMREYFSKMYKKVVYTHRDTFKKEMFDEVNPDIVIIEAVERFSNMVGKKYF